MTRLAFLLVLAACSKSDTAKPLPGTPAAAAEPSGSPVSPGATEDNSATALCARVCKKALGCAGVPDDQLARAPRAACRARPTRRRSRSSRRRAVRRCSRS